MDRKSLEGMKRKRHFLSVFGVWSYSEENSARKIGHRDQGPALSFNKEWDSSAREGRELCSES